MQGHLGVGVAEHRGGDRQHRRDARARPRCTGGAHRWRGRPGSCPTASAPRSRCLPVHLVDEPAREEPVRDLAHADPRPFADGGADRVGAAVLLPVDGAAQRQGLSRSEVVCRGELGRDVEAHRDGVVVSCSTEWTVSVWKAGAVRPVASGAAGNPWCVDLRSPSRARTARGSSCSGRAPCRRSARTRRSARRRRIRTGDSAARAGSACRDRATGPERAGTRPGADRPWSASACRPRSVIQSLDQAGDSDDPDRWRRRSRPRRAPGPGRHAWWPSPGSRCRSA